MGNLAGRGAYIVLNVTAVPGVDSITLAIDGKDPVSGQYFTLLTGSALTTTGARVYLVYPGAPAAAGGITATTGFPLPMTWRVRITHSGTGNFTYSVAALVVL